MKFKRRPALLAAAAAFVVLLAGGVGVALPAGAGTTTATQPPAGGHVPVRTVGDGRFMWLGPWVPNEGTARAQGGAHTDIIGGMPASESYPGMVSVMRRYPNDPNWHTCGGSLVFHRWVLINAHCVTNDDGSARDPSLYHVRIGSVDRTQGGEEAEVIKIIPHPGWDWGTGVKHADRFWDMAMLYLDHYVQAQPLNIPATYVPNGEVRAIGWGVTEPIIEGPLPNMLQELDLRLASPALCTGSPDAPMDEGEICTAPYAGTDAPCYGDSGSPLLQHVRRPNLWEMIGGVSRGTTEPGCGGGYEIYTNWTEPVNRTWIYQVAEAGAAPPWTPPARAVRPAAFKPPTAPVLPPDPK